MPYKDPQAKRDYMKKYRQEKPNILREWRKNNANKWDKYMYEWRESNKDKIKSYIYKEYEKAYSKKYYDLYPEKVIARQKVNDAKKSGKLIPEPCIICGCKKVDAHHEDYTKPLEVIWICRKHHNELHAKKER